MDNLFLIIWAIETLNRTNLTNLVVTSLIFIFGIIGSLLVGVGITYFVEKKTQERAWKREYAVKVAETVYMPLCTQMNLVTRFLEENPFRPVPDYLYFGEWSSIKKENRHLMVDRDFRSEIIAFFDRFRNYKESVDEFRANILSIVKGEAERVFKIKTRGTEPEFRVRYKENNQQVTYSNMKVIDHLISQEHPREYILKDNPRRVIEEFQIQFGQEPIPVAKEKLDDFWNSCVKRMKGTYQNIQREKEGILEDATKLKDKLEERIQEPWKI